MPILKQRSGTEGVPMVADEGFRDRETIIRNVEVINALREHALGLHPLPAELPRPFAPSDRDYLATEQGAELVRKWLSAFTSSIGLVRQFRNELVHGVGRPSDDDTKEVARASIDLLDALAARLRRQT